METIERIPGRRNYDNLDHYQSITCMQLYSSHSFEELRVQDYLGDLKSSISVPAAVSSMKERISKERKQDRSLANDRTRGTEAAELIEIGSLDVLIHKLHSL
jgi:hypothetical protein